MILSHKHKFIYIKTHKTASTSIEVALCDLCGPEDIITPASRHLMKHRKDARAQNYRLDHPAVPKRPLLKRLLRRPERHYHTSVGFYEHMPGWRIKAYIGNEIWSSYYKFTFERNPWDRQVSWYYYKTKSKDPRPPFDAFNLNKRRAWVENYDLYTIDNEICVDFVGRYENIAEDMDKVLETLGLKGKVQLPKTNVSQDKLADYQTYYTDQSREIIGDWYAREINVFNYSF